ncbi:MAG: hypothetical protein E6Q96_01140 [Cyclobacteriaceae bacterium]|nr:MAG: hypothetical protein E6Q96_01140 [Cyclobacteriaceae bacterium]
MLKPAEIYKGIEFVRISQLPAEQQEKLIQTIKRDRIIKIMIGTTLADDCLQYHDYRAWFAQTYPAKANGPASPQLSHALNDKLN